MSFWAEDAEGENAKEVLPGFTRATGVPVDLQWFAWTAAHEKLLTAYAGGSSPDVMMIKREWVSEFAAIGAIVPVPSMHIALLRDQFPGARRSMVVGAYEWGVPWTVDTQVQYYRRDLLAAAGYETPPTRWDDWKAMLHAVKRRQPDRFAVLLQMNWPEHLFNFAVQSGEPMLRDRETRGNFSSEGFRAALAFYKSLFDEGLAPVIVGTEAPDPSTELAHGWVAVYPAGAWTGGDIRRRRLIPDDRWATAPMPAPNGRALSVVAGGVLSVAPTAAEPERAWALIRFLTDPVNQLRLHRVSGTLPSRPSAWRSPLLTDEPVVASFERALERPAIVPTVPEWERIMNEVLPIAEHMVRGQLSIDAAAAAMDARADALLAKRRWLLDRGRIA